MNKVSGLRCQVSGKIKILAVWALLLLGYNSSAAASPTPDTRHLTPDMQITNIHKTLASQTGWLNTSRALTPEDLQGRIILLDFWTFCCINCMHVIPDLQYLENKFGDDLTVIGVHSAKFANERDTENIRSAILRYDIHHPVVNDFDFSIWKKFGVRAWPTFVLINPQGTIEQVYSGEGNRAEVEEDVERLRSTYAGKFVTAKLPIALEQKKNPARMELLQFPGKLAYTADFNGKPMLFVSIVGYDVIQWLNPDGHLEGEIGSHVKGYKDGAANEAQFNSPQGVLYKDGILYIADTNNHALRAYDFKTNKVTTLAGTGKQGYDRTAHNADALTTPLASPWDLAFYPDDKHIAIAMAGTHQLWSYDIEKKTVSVLAGNGRESIDDGRYPFNSLSQPSRPRRA
jgi:thiol-disulfide isomerase/thioredoxin